MQFSFIAHFHTFFSTDQLCFDFFSAICKGIKWPWVTRRWGKSTHEEIWSIFICLPFVRFLNVAESKRNFHTRSKGKFSGSFIFVVYGSLYTLRVTNYFNARSDNELCDLAKVNTLSRILLTLAESESQNITGTGESCRHWPILWTPYIGTSNGLFLKKREVTGVKDDEGKKKHLVEFLSEVSRFVNFLHVCRTHRFEFKTLVCSYAWKIEVILRSKRTSLWKWARVRFPILFIDANFWHRHFCGILCGERWAQK